MSGTRTYKKRQQDGDVSTANILPESRRGRTPNKKAKGPTLGEEQAKEDDLMALVDRIDGEFQEGLKNDPPVEEEKEKEYDPPANQEQLNNSRNGEEEENKDKNKKEEEEEEEDEEEEGEKENKEKSDSETEEEEEGAQVRISEGFAESFQKIRTSHPEYAKLLEKGEEEIDSTIWGKYNFDSGNLKVMVMMYLNRLNFEPETFKVFYRPYDNLVPWVGYPRKKATWVYDTFRTCLGILALELTSLILGHHLDICLQMEHFGENRYRYRVFEETKLWRWATPYNYMFLAWLDFNERLEHITSIIADEEEPAEKFWNYADDIIDRYLTRKHHLENTPWLKRKWEVLRGHKGIMADQGYPYMLTRTKIAREKLERYATTRDFLKSTKDGRIMKHVDGYADLTTTRSLLMMVWDDRDYKPRLQGDPERRAMPSEEQMEVDIKRWADAQLKEKRVEKGPARAQVQFKDTPDKTKKAEWTKNRPFGQVNDDSPVDEDDEEEEEEVQLIKPLKLKQTKAAEAAARSSTPAKTNKGSGGGKEREQAREQGRQTTQGRVQGRDETRENRERDPLSSQKQRQETRERIRDTRDTRDTRDRDTRDTRDTRRDTRDTRQDFQRDTRDTRETRQDFQRDTRDTRSEGSRGTRDTRRDTRDTHLGNENSGFRRTDDLGQDIELVRARNPRDEYDSDDSRIGRRRSRRDEGYDEDDHHNRKLARSREPSEDRYDNYSSEEEYGRSSSSRMDGFDTRRDIQVVRNDRGESKVQIDYASWQRIREFVILADKYVEEYFKFRLLRAKKAKLYRRKNKEEDVGQAYGRGKGGNKGPGVN
jgi:hypothetical protein